MRRNQLKLLRTAGGCTWASKTVQKFAHKTDWGEAGDRTQPPSQQYRHRGGGLPLLWERYKPPVLTFLSGLWGESSKLCWSIKAEGSWVWRKNPFTPWEGERTLWKLYPPRLKNTGWKAEMGPEERTALLPLPLVPSKNWVRNQQQSTPGGGAGAWREKSPLWLRHTGQLKAGGRAQILRKTFWATTAKQNPNEAQLLTRMTQYPILPAWEESNPFPGINSIYLSLSYFTQDVQHSVKNYEI